MATWRVPIDLNWTGPGSPGVNVWSIRTTGDVQSDEVNLQEAVNALHAFYDAGKVNLAGGLTISLGEIVERDTQNRATATWTNIVTPTSQNHASDALQVCVSWRTSLAARRGMGRTFLGPLNHDIVQNDGMPADAWLDTFRTAATNLIADSQSTTNGWAVGVYGLVNKAPEGTTDYGALPHVHRDITGFKIARKFAILRSRRD